MQSTPTLHLLMGLPGAGKSTLARILHEITGAELLSSDEMRLSIFKHPCFSQDEHDRLYGILDHNVEHLLAAGRDAIYDANLNRLHHRQEKYKLAKAHGAKTILWWVHTEPSLAKIRRLNEQDHLLIPDGETPEHMFDRIASILEVPKKDELFIKVDGTNIEYATINKLLSGMAQA